MPLIALNKQGYRKIIELSSKSYLENNSVSETFLNELEEKNVTNEMIDKLSIYAEAGVDEIIISSDFGQTQNEIIDSMYRISEEVMPFFRNTKSQVA